MPPPRQRNGSINRIAVGAKSAYSPRRTCASSYRFRSKKLSNRKLKPIKDATTTAYTYHPEGQIASIRYPSGLKVFYRLGTGAQVGQVTQIDVQEPGKNQPVLPWVSNLAYTALNQPKSWTWSSTDSANRSFDTSGRMTANEFASYQYDAASRLTGITQNLWALQAATDTTPASTYSYLSTLPLSPVGFGSRNEVPRHRVRSYYLALVSGKFRPVFRIAQPVTSVLQNSRL